MLLGLDILDFAVVAFVQTTLTIVAKLRDDLGEQVALLFLRHMSAVAQDN